MSMTDKEIIHGIDFTVKYFNRFFKKIIISPEEWDNYFLPKIISPEIFEPETEVVESTEDIVTDKFLLTIKNMKVFNWTDMDKRRSHILSIYYDEKKQRVLISSAFINRFFQSQKINREYKITIPEWASHLHNKKYLMTKRTWEKIGGEKGIGFWAWDPNKLEIAREDIEKDEKEKIEPESLDDY